MPWFSVHAPGSYNLSFYNICIICYIYLFRIERKKVQVLSSEHVSGTGAAEFPLNAQTYFCDSRSPLRSPLRDLPLPLRSCSSAF